MHGVEARIEAHLSALGNDITNHMTQTTLAIRTDIKTHTTKTVKIATDAQNNQQSHLIAQLHLFIHASEEYNRHMTGISSALLHEPPDSTLVPSIPTPSLKSKNMIHIRSNLQQLSYNLFWHTLPYVNSFKHINTIHFIPYSPLPLHGIFARICQLSFP
jgi:hypothetical protein